jgi:predicted RNase H-like nuclease
VGVVLGIDAAWTLSQPSGVAVVQQNGDHWQLVAAASSYTGFLEADLGQALASPVRPFGSAPHVAALLAASERHCGRAVEIVAVDMPLSHIAITSRRVSDDEVSRAYGARKCSTHTPSATRPGAISCDLVAACAMAGYPLWTSARPAHGRGLVEVYPHPALVELAQASERLRYKVSKRAAYWPQLTPVQRRSALLQEWARIVDLLDERIKGVKDAMGALEPDAAGHRLKAYEDVLDAIVCAWVGVCVLEGNALPFGDEESAIWVPRSPASRHVPPENLIARLPSGT